MGDGESDIDTEDSTRQCGMGASIASKSEGQTQARLLNNGHNREVSATSLSTTGHSRFHTIRRSSEQAQEESLSSESSSAGFSSLSESTRLHRTQNCGGNQ